MSNTDRIRREKGITLAEMSAETDIPVTAISQHLKMSRGFPDGETVVKYLQFCERREPGIAGRLLK